MHGKSAESSMSSRWCGEQARCQLRCRPHHLTVVQNYEIRRQKPSCSCEQCDVNIHSLTRQKQKNVWRRIAVRYANGGRPTLTSPLEKFMCAPLTRGRRVINLSTRDTEDPPCALNLLIR
ncbi:hypothetical protein TNCV_1480171 [Trichonephila clavipes]|nr:hypothetical protein TNCV_1480171 [Trichonephila clavipes]